jgi:hypothetical protein
MCCLLGIGLQGCQQTDGGKHCVSIGSPQVCEFHTDGVTEDRYATESHKFLCRASHIQTPDAPQTEPAVFDASIAPRVFRTQGGTQRPGRIALTANETDGWYRFRPWSSLSKRRARIPNGVPENSRW